MAALLFLTSAALIVLAGANLSRYGDVIAVRTGLGRTWIGVVLTASVTSLPELVTGLSATILHRTPEVAVGDVSGSCVFNLLLFALVELLAPPETPRPSIRSGHGVSLGAGAAGLILVAAALSFRGRFPSLGAVGLPSLILAVLYFGALRAVFLLGRGAPPEPVPPGLLPLRKAAGLYALNAALVVGAAGILPRLAADFADQSGLGRTFVGSILVGMTTSLPEVAVTVAAVRLGAIDLAIGGLLGSNLFDLLILAVDDVAYRPGPILEAVPPVQAVPVLAALLMSVVIAAAWIARAWPRATGRFPALSLALLGIYAVQLLLLFVRRAG